MTAKEKIKETILDLLEKYPADELTVKMICLESGYSKQSLYNNYYNWMDALADAFETEFYGSVGDCDTYHDWVEGFHRVLKFLHSRRKAFLHVYNSSRRDELIEIMRSRGAALVNRGITECSRDMGIAVSPDDQRFMLDFYMYVFMGIVNDYLKCGMTGDPDYIASRCDAMMRFHIRNTLKNLQSM